MSDSNDGFFGGAPGLSWPKANNGVYDDVRLRGVSRGGVIVRRPEKQQMTQPGSGTPLFWDEARTRPKYQLVVTLLCDGRGGALDERTGPQDRGERRLYVRGYMVNAIKDALSKIGASDLGEGDQLYVAWVDEQPSKTKGFDPARLWAAKVVKGGMALPEGSSKAPPQGTGNVANPYADPPAQHAPAAPAQGQPAYQAPAYAPPARQPQQAPTAPPWEQPAQQVPTGPPPAAPWDQPAQPTAPAGPAANPYA